MSFSHDCKNLAIGTQQGGVYNFPIQNQLISLHFSHKVYSNTSIEEITSLDFSLDGRLAVVVDTKGYFQKVLILDAPKADSSAYQILLVYITDQPITSSVWSIRDPDVYVVGNRKVNEQGFKWMVVFLKLSDMSYYGKVSMQNTTVLAFSPDGEYLYQGSPDDDIAVYKYS